jgi:hypothetical protein
MIINAISVAHPRRMASKRKQRSLIFDPPVGSG